jgi:hypothetical protein
MKDSGYDMKYNRYALSGGNKLVLTSPSPYIVERGNGGLTGKYLSLGVSNG